MDLREMDCDAGDWIILTRDRDEWWSYVRTVMDLDVP